MFKRKGISERGSKYRKVSFKIWVLFILTGVFSCQQAVSQTPTPTPLPDDEETISIDTNLVQLEAIVKDKKGRIIKDLTVHDFELVENGKVRPIEFFSFFPLSESRKIVEAGTEMTGIKRHQLKRTFVFIVSNPNIKLTSFINTRHFSEVKTMSYQRFSMQGLQQTARFLNKFINKNLTAYDLVSINDTEADLGTLSSFTNDKEALSAAVDQIKNSLAQGKYPTQNVSVFLRDRDVEWDAGDLIQQNLNTIKMAESAIEQLQKVPGQKLVFLLSRGMLGNSALPKTDIINKRLKSLIEKANQAKVTFYSLSLKTLGESGTPSSEIQGEDTMLELARKTGGRAILNTNDISVGFNDILEENSGYYQLAFAPDEASKSKAYQIKINLKRPDLVAQYRSSVYQDEEIILKTENKEPNIKEKVLSLLKTPFASDTIKIKLTANYQAVNKKQGKFTTAVNIDPQLFQPKMLENGIREVKLDLGIQITEPDNMIARQEIKHFSLKLSEESWRQTLKEGLIYQFDTITEKSGTYSIKIAACINGSSQCGNAKSFIAAK